MKYRERQHQDLAFDLFTLATIAGENWLAIASRTAIEPAELERTEQLGDRLLTALAYAAKRPEKPQSRQRIAIGPSRCLSPPTTTPDGR